jgi:hypothetical protein
MSSFHIRLSTGRDSLNFSISGSVLPVKRPPHSLRVLSPAAGAAAGAAAVSAAACRQVHVGVVSRCVGVAAAQVLAWSLSPPPAACATCAAACSSAYLVMED